MVFVHITPQPVMHSAFAVNQPLCLFLSLFFFSSGFATPMVVLQRRWLSCNTDGCLASPTLQRHHHRDRAGPLISLNERVQQARRASKDVLPRCFHYASHARRNPCSRAYHLVGIAPSLVHESHDGSAGCSGMCLRVGRWIRRLPFFFF